MILTKSCELTITSNPTPSVSISTLFPRNLQVPNLEIPITWRIFISPHLVPPSPYTTHKTTLRELYVTARSLLPLSASSSPMDEILLVNEDGDIMEGSITTPYFWRGERWVTPTARSGGNLGTTRRWALESGLCVEGKIGRKNVEVGEGVWLSNGVRGWGWGRIEDLLSSGIAAAQKGNEISQLEAR